jgi:hypothetical protein
VLEVRLVAGAPTGEERGVEILGAVVGVVVVDLVIVPGDDPRHRGVHRLQVRVGLVLRVAVAILDHGAGLATGVLADVVDAPGGLVDVVADEHHDVHVLVEKMAVRAVVALLELLARPQPETELARVAGCRRRGARASDPAHLVAGHEAVPVPPGRFEARDLHVDAVAAAGERVDRAAPHQPREPLVGGHLPADGDRLRIHAAAVQRFGRQSAPEHDAVRQRRTRRDAKREGMLREARGDNAGRVARRPPPLHRRDEGTLVGRGLLAARTAPSDGHRRSFPVVFASDGLTRCTS